MKTVFSDHRIYYMMIIISDSGIQQSEINSRLLDKKVIIPDPIFHHLLREYISN